jgi:hypothetical protein
LQVALLSGRKMMQLLTPKGWVSTLAASAYTVPALSAYKAAPVAINPAF